MTSEEMFHIYEGMGLSPTLHWVLDVHFREIPAKITTFIPLSPSLFFITVYHNNEFYSFIVYCSKLKP